AVGDELHQAADRGDVGVEARRLGAIHLDAPLDAGQRAAVLDVAQPRHGFHRAAHEVGGAFEVIRDARGELDLHRLADGRAGLGEGGLDLYAGDVRGGLADFLENLDSRLALLPVDEAQAQPSDLVLAVVAAGAHARVDETQVIPAEHALLDFAHQRIHFVGGQVTARVD